MAVKIGSARIDENGKAQGGIAGNQTGKEVSTQKWYKHKKGWIVLRTINSARAEKIALDMEMACKNKYIGYDQSQRDTLYNIARYFQFNCGAVNKPCETDCSALVRVCCAYAGIDTPSFNTANEVQTLMKTGEFIKLTDNKYTDSSDYLMRGDILVTRTQGHTVVVLTNGKYAIPRDNELNIGGILVITKSVFIRKSPKTGEKMGVAYMGDILPFIAIDNETGWYKVKYKNEPGYITNKYTIQIYE